MGESWESPRKLEKDQQTVKGKKLRNKTGGKIQCSGGKKRINIYIYKYKSNKKQDKNIKPTYILRLLLIPQTKRFSALFPLTSHTESFKLKQDFKTLKQDFFLRKYLSVDKH